LKKIEKALKKKEYSGEAKELYEKLKENQKEQIVLQTLTLGKQVEKAILHLEKLKNKKPQAESQPQKN